jgi:protein tyrosine phosphatase (PTP) superfamily phosphohydrolase (DUF442 family)
VRPARGQPDKQHIDAEKAAYGHLHDGRTEKLLEHYRLVRGLSRPSLSSYRGPPSSATGGGFNGTFVTDALSSPHSRFDIADTAARRRAWKGLMWGDHGFLRVWWKNFHWISSEMARANQPSPKRIREYAALGFKTIINLRGESDAGHYLLEREACAAAGIKLITFQVRSRDMPSKEQVIGAERLFDEIAYPAIMHCKSGADRAGLMSALYVMLRQKKSAQEALAQLSRKYGHFRAGTTGLLDFFFETYIAETNGKKPLLDWVREDYDPVTTKKQFMSQWWANIWVDKILRRE